MMPGMAPGPPGTYMPGPFMQPMPYPPGMPPPAGELSLIAYHSLLACLSLCSYVFSRHESDATLVAVFIDNDIAY